MLLLFPRSGWERPSFCELITRTELSPSSWAQLLPVWPWSVPSPTRQSSASSIRQRIKGGGPQSPSGHERAEGSSGALPFVTCVLPKIVTEQEPQVLGAMRPTARPCEPWMAAVSTVAGGMESRTDVFLGMVISKPHFTSFMKMSCVVGLRATSDV